ncbi:MAG: O-antigen ligase family protein [Chlorobiota bacterium]|nr:MAG: O-antigen ligase family protein [Chlorobiota bacterium]
MQKFNTYLKSLKIDFLTIVIALIGTLIALYSAESLQEIALSLKTSIPIEIIFIGIPLGILVVYCIWLNEKIWVYAVILMHCLILVNQKEGIGIQEVMFSVSVLVGLPVWFIKELIIHKRKIAKTGFDVLLLSFFIIMSVTSFITMMLNNGNPLNYIKEWVIILDFLMFFPIRNSLNSKKDIQILLLMLILLALINGITNLVYYRQNILKAAFQWEILAGRKTANEPISIVLLIIGSTIFAHAKAKKMLLISLILSALGLLFLTISFSRGPIVSGLIAVVIMTTRIKFKNSIKTYLAIIVSVLLGAGLMYVLFPNIIKNIGIAVSSRLGSVASVASDVSLGSRVAESTTILKGYIARSPILGVGFGVNYSFYDPLTQETITRSYIHNGYIWSLFKFGIPIAIYFLFLLLYPIFILLYNNDKSDEFKRALSAGVIGYIICALIMNNTSSQFTQYAGALNMMLAWVFTDYVCRNKDNEITTKDNLKELN